MSHENEDCPGCGASSTDRSDNKPDAPQGLTECTYCGSLKCCMCDMGDDVECLSCDAASD